MTITISGVILAGGKARRMQGQDKGLVSFQGKPMITHCLARLLPQVSMVSINANRNHEKYVTYDVPVFADDLPDFQGPLSGMLTALKRARTDYVLFVPCDNPFLSEHLCSRLLQAVQQHNTQLAYANDGERDHPTFCLMSRQLVADLEEYLAKGQRRILTFMQQQGGIAVDFSDEKNAFQNFNTLDDVRTMEENA
ncbi:molybdenum cofactor guanylyltransferase MobA [Actinobacillus delphinicola]|uniref:Molybdenum cofactor guanylyltransferase n=1 Tax=Actinobacillus delphinicola TaxID=51161 RepID=A0A448TSL8_9PAST|nr:molybdenum cofactor guanylyltransferase MobA [Actinobacillus delphinicola]VEJ09034.1 molybdopterin-guanine dinucleotide biosynthesis protein MobA [Actinobacillus delphinicola]